MAQQMETRKVRQATPERWQRALQRALFAGVEAKQLAGSGEWIVASASRPGIAYRTDGLTCDCEAAMLGGDGVCLHRAAYWYAQGVLELDPEPEPPASAAPVVCFRCRGAEAGCPVCQGMGVASLSAQAEALRAAA
jgi:hypothetical protein